MRLRGALAGALLWGTTACESRAVPTAACSGLGFEPCVCPAQIGFERASDPVFTPAKVQGAFSDLHVASDRASCGTHSFAATVVFDPEDPDGLPLGRMVMRLRGNDFVGARSLRLMVALDGPPLTPDLIVSASLALPNGSGGGWRPAPRIEDGFVEIPGSIVGSAEPVPDDPPGWLEIAIVGPPSGPRWEGRLWVDEISWR